MTVITRKGLNHACPNHLHFLIEGILAGIHPCGVITMIGELFGAESKGQVYIHIFMTIKCLLKP